jgi:ABC-type antimicrobial peptide transport system permease subunit
MKSNDLLKMASGNLARRKSRTALTVLGIVIGTISIVLMVALGIGMQDSINEQFEDMNSVYVIEVTKGDAVNSSTRSSEQESEDRILDMDLEFFESIEGVEAVSPIVETNVTMVSGKYEASVQIIGLDTSMMEIFGYEVKSGRLPTDEDATGVFFGVDAIESFEEVESSSSSSSGSSNFGPGSGMQAGGGRDSMDPSMMQGGMPGGEESEDDEEEEEEVYDVDIYFDRINMTLDTSYSPQGGNSSTDADVFKIDGLGILSDGDSTRDRYAYMDITYVQDLIADYNNITGDDTDDGYDSAYVKVADLDDIESIQEYIEAYGYSTSTSSSFIETMQSTVDTITIALGAIGAVALLVAAIGITNTMIMAISERKKEIGVMKVIGATLKDIKRLFLLEAAMIGLLGGIIGVFLSIIFSQLISTDAFSGMAMRGSSSSMFSFSIPPWLVLVSMAFTTLVGVVSGYIPALQAMRSSALEALRNE